MDASVLMILFLASLWNCCCTNQVSLSVLPRENLFEGSFFLLKCETLDSSDEWTVIRNTSKQSRTRCGAGWGKVGGNSCRVGLAVTWDSGVYWCESEDGRTSSVVGVTVSVGQIVVATPYFPVSVGSEVTLSCLTKASSDLSAHFYKDGLLLDPEPTRLFTIRRVSKSDEGLYKCNISDQESPESRLRVSDQSGTPPQSDHSSTVTVSDLTPSDASTPAPAPTPAPDHGSGHLHLGFRLLCHLLVFSPYCVSTVLMVSLYRQRPEENEPVSEQKDEDDVAAVTTHHF